MARTKPKPSTTRIDITVDTIETKIIAHFDDYNSYAIVMSKYSDSVAKISIDQLINELKKVAERKA